SITEEHQKTPSFHLERESEREREREESLAFTRRLLINTQSKNSLRSQVSQRLTSESV
ncbi:hypothetical protein H5410_017284, partial [Solanum commersonii]